MIVRCRLAMLIAFGFSCAAAAAPASDATLARDAQRLLERVATVDGPGVAVLIAKGDTVVFRAARGSAQIELGVPLATNGVFRIASLTKMFTAATVLRLAELGKLSLDDSLAKYLPDFPDAERITLRELLNHTAGISDRVRDVQPGFSRRDLDTDTLLAEIRKRPLDFAPGTRWAYSNAGYILLGAVIEKVCGEPWHVALRKHVVDPLGLRHTQYGAQARLIPQRVAGYAMDPLTHEVNNAAFVSASAPAAAGALVSTLDDLHDWLRALASGRIISDASFRQMITPGAQLPGGSTRHRYGLGIYIWRVRDNAMVGHTGQINGFAAFAGYLPQHDITLVALANDENFDARSMGKRLAAIALGKPFAEVTAVPISEELRQELAGTYRIDEHTLETISVKDGKLFAQRGTSHPVLLQLTADRQLHFVPDELSYFTAVRNAAGAVTRLDYFEDGEGPAQALLRIPDEGR
jgi:D-alanyl-D-alanine carboxypeptidase